MYSSVICLPLSVRATTIFLANSSYSNTLLTSRATVRPMPRTARRRELGADSLVNVTRGHDI